MADITKGEWKYKKGSFNEKDLKDFGIGSICCIDNQGEWHIALIHGDVGYPENVSLANAYLIVAAVNACQSVNQDNPMAVAESIKDMYKALNQALATFQRMPHSISVIRAKSQINKALAKVEGRE